MLVLPLADLWRGLTHNWALSAILITTLLTVAIFMLIIGKYVRIAVNIMQESPLPLAMKVRDFRPLPGEDVEFFATDGLRLRGTLCLQLRRSKPPRGMVLFAPEYKSDRESCARYCRGLWDAGYDLFTFDFRNHGESAEESGYTPRQWPSDREVKDMTGAMQFLEDWLRGEGRPVSYGLFGISRGGGAGFLAAQQRSSVAAMVVDGAFSSDRILEHYLRRWAEVFASVEFVYRNHPPEFWWTMRWLIQVACERKFGCKFPSVQRAIARMQPRPVLFIHGARDSYIPEDQSRLLYAMAPQPRYLWIVPGARHNQAVVVKGEEYVRRTVDFFNAYLANERGIENIYSPQAQSALFEPDPALMSPAPLAPAAASTDLEPAEAPQAL